jgi:hypothetical protein
MNVTIEFNQIDAATNRRSRISTLRHVDLERAISISQALHDNPNVEAVILVEGDRKPARVVQMGRNLMTELGCLVYGLRQPRRQPGARQGGAQPLPGRMQPAV